MWEDHKCEESFIRKADINKILPHREPISLIDSISKISVLDQAIIGHSILGENNEGFRGHFPGNPVYPGVLQIEMMGQLGLCLSYFLRNNTTKVLQKAIPVKGLFTKIHKAGFLSQIQPGENLQIIAKMIEYDEFLGLTACQIYKSDILCSYSILEVYFDE